MNTKGNNNIPSSKRDDDLLTLVTERVYNAISNKYILSVPDTWRFECGSKAITFKDIKQKMVENGVPIDKANDYYGEDSSIETDAHIIYLTMKLGDKIVRNPIFIGEMKKQGTNDKRVMEGKKKQAIGNAAPDRVPKNYGISADYCVLCDEEFFPYNVFLHGCDFKEEEITKTIKAKLQPFFGKLNNLNPFFDKDIPNARKGGSCFYQGGDFTYEQLYKICFDCCELGVKHYLSKYGK